MSLMMSLSSETATYYEVLDISPSASPAEVREAYLRAKAAYNKDSIALYSLIDSSDREDILRRIEEAYEVLSNEEKRRLYDSHHGIIENTGAIDSSAVSRISSKVISIDRVPPMEAGGSEHDILVAPPTDFAATEFSEVAPNPTPVSVSKVSDRMTDPLIPRTSAISTDIAQEILDESQWQGSFLRRVREAQNISIEEMSNVTKISKSYIVAIEQDDFKKLPALVFVRGFIIQVCRLLKLPQEKVLDAYLRRYNNGKIGK